MVIDSAVERIIERALEGRGASLDELLYLMRVEPYSREHFALQWAAREVSVRSCDGIGEVHAQVGIDANPCSGNCFHCSFAATHNKRPVAERELTLEEICTYAREYVEQDANTITLMITADYDFEKFLEIIAAVREAVGPDMPLMANMGDFDVEMAHRLKAAGAGSVYHAVRMGEGNGRVSSIPLERRFETYAAANEAELKIAGCCENVCPDFTEREIAELFIRLRDEVRPQLFGCQSRLKVSGTRGVDTVDFPKPTMSVYSAAFTLCMAGVVRYLGCSCRWAEVGTNPRDWALHTERDGLTHERGSSVESFFASLEEDGYKTLRGPSKNW